MAKEMQAMLRGGKKAEGVFYREKDGDWYYIIRYYNARTKKYHKEGVGWQSQGITPSVAVKVRQRLLVNIERGEHPMSLKEEREVQRNAEEKKQRNVWTFNALLEDYITNYKIQKGKPLKSANITRGRFVKYLQPFIGDLTPGQLTQDHLITIKKNVQQLELAPQTLKHILGLVKCLASWGRRYRQTEELSCVIEMPVVYNQKDDCLTIEQLGRVIETLDQMNDQNIADLIRLAMFTGMRRGELLKLQWNDVDFENNLIHIRNPKGGKDQVISINELAKAVLKKHERLSPEYVFPNPDTGKPYTDIRRHLNRYKRLAGLPADFRPLHGLRHTFASHLASSGKVDIYTLQKLLTHKSTAVTQRYAHLIDEAQRRASNVLVDIFNQLPKGNLNIVPIEDGKRKMALKKKQAKQG